MNKKLLMFGIPILALGLVVAGWAILYSPDSSSGFEILSTEPILYEDTFSFTTIDVTNSSAEKIEKITIDNVDSPRALTLGVETLYTDFADDDCVVQPYDFDVIVTFENGTISQVYDGDSLIVPYGNSNVTVKSSVSQNACPGNLTTFVILEG